MVRVRGGVDRKGKEEKGGKQYSTAAFLTKSELGCDCFCLLLLLPLKELPVTTQKHCYRGGRGWTGRKGEREQKREGKKTNIPPFL